MTDDQVKQAIDHVVSGIYRQYPELLEKYGERGKEKCREDNEHHFKHLRTAYEADMPKIFTDYAIWLNNVLTSRGMKSEHLIDNFDRIAEAMGSIDAPERETYIGYLKEANQKLANS
ncbi:hypothetical protein GKZ89_09895 [Bacillus mangrovi]|uniref:Uncharacterized protein n=1 Tax=Metabacillus mangrovi TaxID=1491830 RepID=A0A7X2V4S8_9BACI|nr:hypothetical protein [Metabacillus mangrovi]MTH53715.1 hypothetical protein [Metabacillus mangrovi]